jgi:5-methyltetrahydropteroyltriglutamate--homocysteine methyltransferase
MGSNLIRRCYECGHPMGRKEIFCPKCGAKQGRGLHYAKPETDSAPPSSLIPRLEAPVTPQPEASPKVLLTTIAGSLPKPAWLAPPNQLWAPWLLDGERLAEGQHDAVRLALAEQRRAGIDIASDGEQTRRHFVTTFIEALEGVDFEHRKTVRIRQRYDADVPVVVGPVARTRPIFVEDARFLRSQTSRRVKFTLPGPMTMVDTLYDDHYKSREKLAMEFAAILNAEAREMDAAGIDVIQFDEPAFNVYMDEVRDWGIAALEKAAAGLKCRKAVHICYGYGIKANTDWKKTLGSEWRQYESTFPLLARSRIDQVSLECANSKVPLELLGLLKGKDLLVGAVDVATDVVETPEQVAATIRAAMKYVEPAKLYPCTNCGMVPLAREVAAGKLKALGAGAALVRKEL